MCSYSSSHFSIMATIICFLALCLTAVAALPSQQRIVGGSLTTISQYPSMAGMLMTYDNINYNQGCGGTIINNRSVLSAAHCFYGMTLSQIRVRVGSSYANSGGIVHFVSLVSNHESYSPFFQFNDISVVRVSSAFTFGTNVQVARIAGPNYNPGDNQSVWAVGWGLTSFQGTSSEQLRDVIVHTVNHSTCQNIYTVIAPIIETMLCAGGDGRGVCNQDSGGPLIHSNVVIGITSMTADCGHKDYPAVFTRVSAYTDWIQTNA